MKPMSELDPDPLDRQPTGVADALRQMRPRPRIKTWRPGAHETGKAAVHHIKTLLPGWDVPPYTNQPLIFNRDYHRGGTRIPMQELLV